MNSSSFIHRLRTYKFLLPPLSGFTDYPYRTILATFHPPFMSTEMISAQAIIRNNHKTMKLLSVAHGTHYNGIQLFGSDPNIMSEAAMIAESLEYDYIDINMGCTIQKITSKGAGIALMKQEDLASSIVSTIVKSVNIPVSCKIRIGVTTQEMNAVPFSQKLMDAGATAITMHRRTGEKKFGPLLNIIAIKEMMRQVSIPIVVNGGIFTGKDAQNVIHQTGAAGVMPGRGLLGNPWLISELLSAFSHSSFSFPTLQNKKNICLRHLDALCTFYGERKAVMKMRSILPYYFSNCYMLKYLKETVKTVMSYQEIVRLLDNISESHHQTFYNISAFR